MVFSFVSTGVCRTGHFHLDWTVRRVSIRDNHEE